MTVLGYILFGVGCIIGLVGDMKFLVVAYRRSLLWLFGCLFFPPVGLIFFLLNVRETWKPFVLSTVGFLIAGLGYWVGGSDFLP